MSSDQSPPPASFAAHAKPVVFPREPADLLSGDRCPACFTITRSATCPSCSLNLGHAAMAEIAQLSTGIAAQLDRRLALIGRIRFETAEAKKAAPVAAAAAAPSTVAPPTPAWAPPSPPIAAPVAVSEDAPAHSAAPVAVDPPVAVTPPAAAPAPAPSSPSPAQPAAAPSGRRGSSIQVLLLIAGISLLSLAAVLFLIYAFINFGLIWRSVIIGVVTVAMFATATILRRRNLAGTAEGIAAFAIVLVYLDAFAVRANGLFGADTVDGSLYWGITMAVSAVAFVAWHRLTSLRTPHFVGFATFGVGAALVAFGIASPLADTTRFFLAALALGVSGLVHPLATPRTAPKASSERVAVLALSILGLLAALVFSTAAWLDLVWAPAIAFLSVALVASVIVIVTLRSTQLAEWLSHAASAFAALAGFAAAAAFYPIVSRDPGVEVATILPPVAAWVITLGLDVATRRSSDLYRAAFRWSRLASGIVAALALAYLLLLASFHALLAGIAGLIAPWATSATEPLTSAQLASPNVVIAIALIVVLFVAQSAAVKQLVRRTPFAAAGVAATAIVAVPLLTSAAALTAGWLAISAITVGVMIWRKPSGALAIVLTTASASALFLGYCASWVSSDTWLWGSLATIAIVIGSRAAMSKTSVIARGGALAVATSLGFVAAAALALDIVPAPSGEAALRFVAILAVAVFALSAAPVPLLSVSDRRALYWTTLPVAGIAVFLLWADAATSTTALPALTLALSAALLGGLLAWVILRVNAACRPERVIASIAIAPTVFYALDAFARTLNLPQLAQEIAPISATLLVAAGALAISLVRTSPTPRLAREAGIALVFVPAVVSAISRSNDTTWLVLVLAGLTVFFLSISGDGLFASTSKRKHLGWLALAFATAGLWWRLTSSSVTAIEPFVLPLAGALLLVALLVWRANRASGTRSAPAIALGGLLVALVPIALTGAEGAIARAIAIAAVSTALLALGSAPRLPDKLRPYLDVAAIAGTVGILCITVGRAAFTAPWTPTPDRTFDAWLAFGALTLLAAATAHALRATRTNDRARLIAAHAVACLAVTVTVGFEISAAAPTAIGQARVAAAIVLAAILHIASVTVDRAILRVPLAITTATLLAIASSQALTMGALTPVELAGLLVLLALASSVVSLLAETRLEPRIPRRWRESAIPAVAGLALLMLAVARTSDERGWLVLIGASVVALLLALSADGLFGTKSPRKHLGWLALGLATSGLWWRLGQARVDDIEAYVLPLAATLIVIAIAQQRATRQQGGFAAPAIVLGGLLVALLPLAVASANAPVRAAIVFAAAAALALVGVFTRSATLRPFLDAAAAAGVVGVLAVVVSRASVMVQLNAAPAGEFDGWLIAGLLVLLATALGFARIDDAVARKRAATTTAIIAIAVFFTFVFLSDGEPPVQLWRTVAAIVILSALHVATHFVAGPPFTRVFGWVAFGLAAALAFGASVRDTVEPVELTTLPLAAALLTVGIARLRSQPELRSWPALGVGLILLFLPSLFATASDRPLWRVAALAIVGIAVILIGLRAKLQAPFLIAALVTIIHTVATFSPQVRSLYETHSWLVWIIIGSVGGTILVVFAARFEKSLHSTRETFSKVSQLR